MILYHGSLRYEKPNLQIFFKVYHLISEGVSDMHCMSPEYLADELKTEYQEKMKL